MGRTVRVVCCCIEELTLVQVIVDELALIIDKWLIVGCVEKYRLLPHCSVLHDVELCCGILFVVTLFQR